MKYNLLTGLSVLAMMACNNPTAEKKASATTDTAVKDTHTQSNADSILLKHLDLDIQVNMDQQQISGHATWAIDNPHQLPVLRLDTYELSIDSTTVDGKLVPHTLDAPVTYLGSRLNIPVSANSKTVTIWYKTGKNATALQWLQPQQTLGKKHPFLYTQSESVYARTWIPCGDGPGIRYTYSARVTAPKGLLALMSAENPQAVNDSSIYHFKMELPIPAYLMALAVGDITFRKIDERTGVYAEPAMIDKARYEFEEVGKMVHTAENLYGPYRWGRYDVLVLPPGFPIGGMENPRLTFCTPTIIAGDRSLTSLIAHELAHSWSGNLVTNATWSDFWLNEGFTDYFERRIMEAMMGKSYSDMLWELGYQDLVAEVAAIGKDSKDTWLKLNLEGRSADDSFTSIAYEKGAHFLKLIETVVGREKFDHFLKTYFDTYAFKTMNTAQFLKYLDANLIKGDTALSNKIDIQAWVYGPGIPANCPRVDQERFQKVDEARAQFLKATPPAQLATQNWSTQEWLHFLRKMPQPLSLEQMQQLDGAFHFTKTGNSEIADQWFVMAIAANYKAAYPAMEQFLRYVGRGKFLQPLYGEMMKTPANQEMAKALYAKYHQNYHPIAQEALKKILK